MPNAIVPDEGIADELRRIVAPGLATSNSWRCVLWVNDMVPDATSVLSDLVLASFPGYTFVTLDPAKWTAPAVVDGCGTTTYDTTPLMWTVTGPTTETLYGYALVDPTAGVIRLIQRFDDEDITPLENGGRVVLLPTYTFTSAACGGDMLAAAPRRRRKRRRKKRAR